MKTNIQKIIIPILKKQGILKAAVFGSYARGEQSKKSDIDLLIKFGKNHSLLNLIMLKHSLEEKLNKKVDILSYNGINPHLRKTILKEQKIFYEKA